MIFAIAMKDGSVSVMHTVGRTDPADAIAKWPEAMRDAVVSVHEIEASTIPPDRTFRNAWKLDGGAIAHDMEKAAAIQLERMRKARGPVLAELDAAWMKAVGTGDKVAAAAIEAKRQALRDIPQTIDAALKAAATPDALKAVWPDELAPAVKARG